MKSVSFSRPVLLASALVILLALMAACAPKASATPAPAPKPAPAPGPVPAPKPTAAAPKPAPSPAVVWPPAGARLPDVLIMGSLGTGTGMYVMMSGIREVIEKNSPMKARVEPYKGEVDAVLGLKKGLWSTMTFATNAVMPAHLGWGYWSAEGEGPVKLRSILRGNDYLVSMVTTRQSGIKTMADMKGKRLAVAPKTGGWSALTSIEEAYLAFADLTLKDVVSIPVSGVAAGYPALQEGRIDAIHGVHNTAVMAELQASPRGLWWLPLPHGDAAGWKRLQSVAPMVYPAIINKGFIGNDQKPLEVGGFFTGLFAMDTSDEYLVYAIVKALDQGYAALKAISPDLAEWTVDAHAFNNIGTIPYHPGSIRYFKEKGIWGPAQQAQHEAQLDAEKKTIAGWKPKPQ